ncbi:MAG: hypothetical protein OIN88_01145 [Candidatus Methanoperedens sp.]|nr:hypothetical protein [Candidatus Methanoperedens sp.]MCZ7359789.1 hypothetical protein [Candidatus Methanoperedens sp.]HLB71403.1 hypothetical protein [Candidatus Methanoperedens sp.]
MAKTLPIIMILLLAALSGCIGSNSSDENVQEMTFERANLNLDANIVDVKLSPGDVRAGEKVEAKLVIANTGTEKIVNESIEIKAKVKSLDDFLANLALKFMSDESKTRTFPMDFQEDIQPGSIKPLVADFQTQQELQGKNLAGKYMVTVILSVNGQKVAGKVVPITLLSGKPRDELPNTTSSNVTPTITLTAAPTETLTPEITVTPTPTPEAVTVSEPTGNTVYLRIMGWKFTESSKEIDAGDKVLWHVLDDDTFTIVEKDRKLPNITVSYKTTQFFNTTGTYRFSLYYPKMRTEPSTQTITVKLNTSQ